MLSIRTFIALSKTKIDDVNSILCLVISTNQEIIRLDVSMDNTFFMYYLDSLDHLDSDVQNSL